MKSITLNITRKQAKAFLNFLANEGYWGQTFCSWDLEHLSYHGKKAEETIFDINGHKLSNVSDYHHSLVIDGGYVSVSESSCYIVDGKKLSSMDYALMKLGF